MIILGFDPGSALVGYGAIRAEGADLELVAYGCIEMPPHTPPEEGLPRIYKEAAAYIAELMPDVVAIEEIFHNKNQKTVIAVGQARGVLLLAAGEARVPVSVHTPPEIKLAVTGYGRAEKMQVQKMVSHILKLSEIPKPDDAADALAVAICASSRYKREI